MQIEKENELRQNGSIFGRFGMEFDAKKLKEQGVKSKRDKNFKHFSLVGFVGSDNKSIPRWAVDMEKLKTIKNYQAKMLDPVKIFGKWGPKVVQQHFKQEIIFRKGINQESYIDERNDRNIFRFK